MIDRSVGSGGYLLFLILVGFLFLEIQVRNIGAVSVVGMLFGEARIRLGMTRGTIHHMERLDLIFVLTAIV